MAEQDKKIPTDFVCTSKPLTLEELEKLSGEAQIFIPTFGNVETNHAFRENEKLLPNPLLNFTCQKVEPPTADEWKQVKFFTPHHL